jgi:hypothetical protein
MFKKSISFILITAQFGLATGACASETPEMKLLSQSIALSGRNLSPEQTQAELVADFSSYAKVAQVDGQSERMEQALIALNMYTPAQAHELTQDALALASQSTVGADSSNASARFQAAMLTLMAKYPLAGAEYSSGCSWGTAMGLVGLVGTMLGSIFLITGASNTYLYATPDHSDLKIGDYMTGIGAFVLLEGMITYHHGKGCDD